MGQVRDTWCALNLDVWAHGILRGHDDQMSTQMQVTVPEGAKVVVVDMRPVAEAVRRELLAGALEALADWVRG